MTAPDMGPLFTAYLLGDPGAALTVEHMASLERTARGGRYVRLGRRDVLPGHRLKDPRGVRVVDAVTIYGYRLRPDAAHPYEFMRPWPTVGRLKVIIG